MRRAVIGTLGVVALGTTGLALASIFGDYSDPAMPQASVQCGPPDCVGPNLESGLTTTPSSLPNQNAAGGGGAGAPANPAQGKPGDRPGAVNPSQTPGSPSSPGTPSAPGTRRPGTGNNPHDGLVPPTPRVPAPAHPGLPPVTVAYSTRDAGYHHTQGVYTVTNNGATTLAPWHLTFTLPRSGGLLGGLLGGHRSKTVTVNGGAIAPGGHATVTFDLSDSRSGPSGCLLNGKACVAG
ncbi:hypothetical protein J4573_45650 [Actinomadura barringtoniae]|uniref:CBM2 domain-containing protein n=1 Tax=Actinomadura barringtoniae TaxID=1427535 RepID=A0A939PTE4_9ACTN|nr:hypothetical protein [Actinomadura barringtoniae]MBO2454441.1 hypothetical protein [Actinomadura barringtoniae]